MGSTIDYAAYLLGIPNSHGGPINGLIVQSFSLDSQTEGVPSLNGEGEFLELFFGAGASVVLGLEGTLSVKIERMQNPNEYEMTFLIEGAITADLMAGVEAGVSRFLFASLSVWLDGAGYDWVVCTGTDQLRNSFHRLGIATQVLATADPATLPDGGAGWGRYYDHHPVVMAIRVADGMSALRTAGLLRLIQPVESEAPGEEAMAGGSYGHIA